MSRSERLFAHKPNSLYIYAVAITRTRKNKENPHYNFLYSWTPSEPHVKRESNLEDKKISVKLSASKKAAELAKEDSEARVKKDILKSLILVSFVLIAEVVVYLARNKFSLP